MSERIAKLISDIETIYKTGKGRGPLVDKLRNLIYGGSEAGDVDPTSARVVHGWDIMLIPSSANKYCLNGRRLPRGFYADKAKFFALQIFPKMQPVFACLLDHKADLAVSCLQDEEELTAQETTLLTLYREIEADCEFNKATVARVFAMLDPLEYLMEQVSCEAMQSMLQVEPPVVAEFLHMLNSGYQAAAPAKQAYLQYMLSMDPSIRGFIRFSLDKGFYKDPTDLTLTIPDAIAKKWEEYVRSPEEINPELYEAYRGYVNILLGLDSVEARRTCMTRVVVGTEGALRCLTNVTDEGLAREDLKWETLVDARAAEGLSAAKLTEVNTKILPALLIEFLPEQQKLLLKVHAILEQGDLRPEQRKHVLDMLKTKTSFRHLFVVTAETVALDDTYRRFFDKKCTLLAEDGVAFSEQKFSLASASLELASLEKTLALWDDLFSTAAPCSRSPELLEEARDIVVKRKLTDHGLLISEHLGISAASLNTSIRFAVSLVEGRQQPNFPLAWHLAALEEDGGLQARIDQHFSSSREPFFVETLPQFLGRQRQLACILGQSFRDKKFGLCGLQEVNLDSQMELLQTAREFLPTVDATPSGVKGQSNAVILYDSRKYELLDSDVVRESSARLVEALTTLCSTRNRVAVAFFKDRESLEIVPAVCMHMNFSAANKYDAIELCEKILGSRCVVMADTNQMVAKSFSDHRKLCVGTDAAALGTEHVTADMILFPEKIERVDDTDAYIRVVQQHLTQTITQYMQHIDINGMHRSLVDAYEELCDTELAAASPEDSPSFADALAASVELEGAPAATPTPADQLSKMQAQTKEMLHAWSADVERAMHESFEKKFAHFIAARPKL